MATPLRGLQIRDLSGGMISNAADILLPQNVAKQSINFNYDTLGRVTQRNGTTQLGATVESGRTGTGLFSYIDSAGTTNRLIAGFNASAYAYNGSVWSLVRGSLDGTKIRMTAFADTVFMVGGGAATETWTGSGSFAAGGLASGAPSGKFIDSFKERVYIAGSPDNPDRLFRSSVISSAGLITWDTSSTGPWVDINPDDNNNITGLNKTADVLLIAKERALYRWNGSSLGFIANVGTPSQESMVNVKSIVFFFSSSPLGIFASDGGIPIEISQPVHDWLQGIDSEFYVNVSAVGDANHVYFNIGSVTKDGRTYANVQLVYTLSSRNWYVNTFADDFRVMATYISSSDAVTIVGADTDGMVQTIFSGTTDNGTPITYEYQTKELEFDSRSTTKHIEELVAFVKNGAGGVVAVSADGGPFKPAGQVTRQVTFMGDLNFQGHYFSLKFLGSNTKTPVIFEGFEVTKVTSLGHVY